MSDCSPRPKRRSRRIPRIPEAAGIYLFSELDHAIYVGQTRKLRQRLRNHTNPLGKNNQAAFAFLLAKDKAERAASTPEAAIKRSVAVDEGAVRAVV